MAVVKLPDPERPVIVTERLELWMPTAEDIKPLIDIVMHEETARYLGSNANHADHYTRFQRNAGSWILHGYGGFIVRERGAAAAIGNCGIFHSYRGMGKDFDDKPEAGWIIAHGCEGKGYAREAMDAALSWFERAHGQQIIVCMIEQGNEASFALASRLGFAEIRRTSLPKTAEIVLMARGAE
ncbi:GNAT family N-acetyltransferase [Altererythrobacter sp. MF3-039]|uniref:GNAT family N-acetyltransferase n=1 Tax=Altererythrobacter sp. MF3-039 TaxID=3252901 RepID=UPI00390C6206